MNPLILFMALSVSAAADAPLAVKEPVADLGEVKAGVPLSHIFELTNRSAKPLTIENVAAGCGCLQPKLSKTELAPGESAKLDVSINTLSQAAGPQEWTAKVAYRLNGVVGQFDLQVRAKILREIDIQPVALALTTDKKTTHPITLTDRRQKPLTITDIRTTSAELKAELGERNVAADGEVRHQVLVTVSDNYPAGTNKETVQIFTDDATYRELKIPVVVNRRSPDAVLAMPDHVELRLAKGQTAANALVRLRGAAGQPVVVDRIEADHSAVKFRWAAGPEAMATLRLGVEIPADALDGKAIITVHLKEPKGQVLKIPLEWRR